MAYLNFDDMQDKINRARAAGVPDELIQERMAQETASGRPKDEGFQFRDLLPIAGGVVGSFGGPVTAMGGAALGEALRQQFAGEETDFGGIATSGALGLVGGGAGPGLKLLGGLGKKAATGAGKNLALRGLRPSKPQTAGFRKDTGENLEDFVIKNKLFEKGTQPVDDLLNPLYQQYDDLALKSGAKIKVSNILGKYDKRIAELDDIATGDAKALAGKLREEADLVLQKWGNQDVVDIKDITMLRRNVDKVVNQKSFSADPLASGKNDNVRDIYKDVIDEATGGATKPIGRQIKDLKAYRDIAEIQQDLGKGSLPAGLKQLLAINAGTTVVGGGAGYVGSGGDPLVGALTGLGFTAAANNPRVLAFLAKNLLKIGAKTEVAAGAQVAEAAAKRTVPGMIRGAAPTVATVGGLSLLTAGGGPEEETDYSDLMGDVSGQETGFGGQEAVSPGGQWRWDATANDWVPNETGTPQANSGITRDEASELMKADLALTGGKNLDKIKALFEMSNPKDGKKKSLSEADKKFKIARIETQKALDLFDYGGVKTGPLENIKSGYEELTGTQREEVTVFKSKVALARTSVRNALLGANMSAQEIESLLASIFDFSQQPKIVRAKMASLIDMLQSYEDEVSGGAPVSEMVQEGSTGLDLYSAYGE